MKEPIKLLLCALAALVIFAAGMATATAQLLPPPPVIGGASSDGFTERDRLKLSAIYRMTRAMHTRLFPLSEEQRILNGGSSELTQ